MTRGEAEEMIHRMLLQRDRVPISPDAYLAARRAIVDALCGAAPTTGGAATGDCRKCAHGLGSPVGIVCALAVKAARVREDLVPVMPHTYRDACEDFTPRAPASPGESAAPTCPECAGDGYRVDSVGYRRICLACGGTGRAGGSQP